MLQYTFVSLQCGHGLQISLADGAYILVRTPNLGKKYVYMNIQYVQSLSIDTCEHIIHNYIIILY